MRQDVFNSLGGRFITSPGKLREKLMSVKAILFDWDGVFNHGEKGQIPSPFNEVDSMGINMLRFGFYMITNQIPYTAIVTGETNHTAFHWAKREKLNDVFFQVKHKVDILKHLQKESGIAPHEVLFVFDDILDLSLAKESGVRFLVNRKSNPLFIEYCVQHRLCDYITFSAGNDYAIREISEVTLDGIDMFEKTIEERMQFNGIYSDFLTEKMKKNTQFWKSSESQFILTIVD